MADLIDRLSGADEKRKLPCHQFIASLRLYAAGLVSKDEFAKSWGLEGDELEQANQLAGIVDTKASVTDKALHAMTVDAVAMLIEWPDDRIFHQDGVLAKKRVKQILGLV